MKLESPLVSIWSITYNHVEFIKDCLEGILSQKTNFKYELVIGDDASTDGTSEILRDYATKYPKIIKPIINQTNIGSYRNSFETVLPELKGKYIAICEGDDYWTDPLKLQKQVDFLEANTSYSMTCSNVEILGNSGFIRKRFSFNESFDIDAFYLLKNNHISTCTVLANSSFVKSIKPIQMNFTDKYIWLALLQTGRCFYLNEVTARYRMHGMGSYTSLREYSKAIKRIEDYIEYKNLFPSQRKVLTSQIYITSIKGILSCIKHRRYKELWQLINLTFVN
jgi:glycosyltransferase involved in cell wall biosynthesis